jgi:hypothetical protein
MNTSTPRMRVGTWIRMDIPNHGSYTGFTYVDPRAGFSSRGWLDDAPDHIPAVVVRLPLGVPWRELSAEEVGAEGLETPPDWVAEYYGPQPPAGTEWGWWRDNPTLAGRFHPEYPDDLQVLVHDGGPRLTTTRPEVVWVRANGGAGDVFTGRLLNQPHQLTTVKEGDEIRFVANGGEHPLMVTDKYLAERANWDVTPCNKCGLGELFDAPSDLVRVVFPDAPAGADAVMQAFTAFCGACGGILLVKAKGADGT